MHRINLTAACLVAFAPALAALDGGEADLTVGPIVLGQDVRLELATAAPGSAAFVLIDVGPSAVPAFLFGLPSLQVSPVVDQVLPIDGLGRAELVVPAGTIDVVGLTGVPLTVQAVHLDAALALAVSEARTVLIGAPAPPQPLFEQLPSQLLPLTAQGLAADRALAGDVDQDGWPDVVLTSATGVSVWRNAGLGDPILLIDVLNAAPVLDQPVGDALLFDLDGDAVLDLYAGAGFDFAAPVPDRLMRGVGDGSFGDVEVILASTGVTSGAVAVDVDRDGDLDLALARSGDPHSGAGSAPDRLLINDGLGGFTDDQAFLTASWNSNAISSSGIDAGDIDLDGDFDLFIGKSDVSGAATGSPGAPDQLLLNSGFGVFSDGSLIALPELLAGNANAIALGDIDLDGDLDVLIANSSLGISTGDAPDLMINQGGLQAGNLGIFLDEASSPLEDDFGTQIRLSALLADFDLDGDLDAHFTVHDLPGGSLQPVWLNDGFAQGGVTGQLTPLSFDAGDILVAQSAVADFDLDGDLDLILPSTASLSGDPIGDSVVLYENLVQ